MSDRTFSSPSGRQSLAVLVPAWQPEPVLVELVAALAGAGFGPIVVVDDGSSADRQTTFAELERRDVRVLRHAVNLGKGRALKTGFNCLLAEYPAISGVVMADGDGQHTVPDILCVADALATTAGQPVLGVRTFGSEAPLRSRVGNAVTRVVFYLLTGTRLADTQTGLRAFPRTLLPELLELEGERYEYEMTVLAHICRHGKHPVEVPIETVYLENNRSSHFDPVRDSMRIYFVLLRFYASSLAAAVIDIIGFGAAYALTGNVVTSVAVGRLSSLVNFALNQKFVFHARAGFGSALWRYYVLVVAVAVLSSGSILALTRYGHWNVFAAKVVADALLSLVSFSVQRTFVFRRGRGV